jgi:cathepsin B
MKLVVLAVLVVAALARDIIDFDIIKKVNDPKTGAHWKAGINSVFLGVPMSEAKRFLGVSEIPAEGPSEVRKSGRTDLPEEYNAAEQYPGCVIAIRDQKSCGSCWAFGCSESLSDRFNIRDGTCSESTQVILSPQDLVSCDKQQQGCNGGWPIKAWNYTQKTGLLLDACDPYTSGGGQTGTCKAGKSGAKCPSSKGTQVFYHSKGGYAVLGEEAMMTDIYEHGPIEVVFEVYRDFFNYKSGIYHHVSGSLAGYHAVKMVGWGVQKNTKYWIVYNSWGTSWGQDGVFWILRGKNECKIEKPDDDKPTLCNSAAEADIQTA